MSGITRLEFPGPSLKSSNLAFADKDGGSIYGKSSKRQHPVTKVDNINTNVKSKFLEPFMDKLVECGMEELVNDTSTSLHGKSLILLDGELARPEGYGFIKFVSRAVAERTLHGNSTAHKRMACCLLIYEDVVEEVEEKFNKKLSDEVAKVKKVQDNVNLVLQILLETNPEMYIDMAQISGNISGHIGSDGTPLTGDCST
ncbi:hypothetical protein AgCh_017304 [Apium graveolens]